MMCMEWLNGGIRACDVLRRHSKGEAEVRKKLFAMCHQRHHSFSFLLRGVSLITKNSIVCLYMQTQLNLNMLLPWDYLHFFSRVSSHVLPSLSSFECLCHHYPLSIFLLLEVLYSVIKKWRQVSYFLFFVVYQCH